MKYGVMLAVACVALSAVLSSLDAAAFKPPRAVAASPSAAGAAYDWLQFNFDPQHSGNNSLETAITLANVSSLRLLFQVALPAIADGAPVYLAGVTTASGVRDLIFVTTRAGHIVALDAHTGAQIWVQQYGAAGCLINNNPARNEACYTTSSPAIDPNRQFVYSYGLDGYVHKFAVGTGDEVVTGGWPELTSLKVYDEKGSSALSIATAGSGATYLYVAHAGYSGDAGDYQGHITAINLADGTQKVFNALCSSQAVHFVDSRTTVGTDCYPQTQSAIWGRAGVVYDPDIDRIYMATGNGTFSPTQHLWGDTVFALNSDGTGATGNPLDTFTPANYQQLQNADADLGSTEPVILPTLANSTVRHLAVQSGKDGLLRLLNLDNLSGQGGIGHTGGEIQVINVPQGGGVLPTPAVWVSPCDSSTWVFVANSAGLSALQLTIGNGGVPSLTPVWHNATSGTSPIIANNVVYIANSGRISALNPAFGNPFWSGTQIGGIHWESPIVANGTLYITDQSGKLTAYVPSVAAAPRAPGGIPYFCR